MNRNMILRIWYILKCLALYFQPFLHFTCMSWQIWVTLQSLSLFLFSLSVSFFLSFLHFLCESSVDCSWIWHLSPSGPVTRVPACPRCESQHEMQITTVFSSPFWGTSKWNGFFREEMWGESRLRVLGIDRMVWLLSFANHCSLLRDHWCKCHQRREVVEEGEEVVDYD